jgi:hypothetical protein
MAEYLVELYVSHGDDAAAQQQAARAEQASAELTRAGSPVRCLHSIFVAEDETSFLHFEAGSAELVVEVLDRAGLRPEHISLATSTPHDVAAAPAVARTTHRTTSMKGQQP